MASLSLRDAAEQVGVSKSTIFRAIRAGRLSATRDDDGNFRVDASELFRVYEPASKERTAAERVEARAVTQDAMASEAVELRVKYAELDGEVKALRLMLEAMQKREEDLMAQRDRWASALEASQRQLTHQAEKQAERLTEARSWWAKILRRA
jgi:excisionase family DNA binding protein